MLARHLESLEHQQADLKVKVLQLRPSCPDSSGTQMQEAVKSDACALLPLQDGKLAALGRMSPSMNACT